MGCPACSSTPLSTGMALMTCIVSLMSNICFSKTDLYRFSPTALRVGIFLYHCFLHHMCKVHSVLTPYWGEKYCAASYKTPVPTPVYLWPSGSVHQVWESAKWLCTEDSLPLSDQQSLICKMETRCWSDQWFGMWYDGAIHRFTFNE